MTATIVFKYHHLGGTTTEAEWYRNPHAEVEDMFTASELLHYLREEHDGMEIDEDVTYIEATETITDNQGNPIWDLTVKGMC